LQAKSFTKKYDETSNTAKNRPVSPTKREKISVNQCLKKYYSCFMTTWKRGVFDEEGEKGKEFYYRRLRYRGYIYKAVFIISNKQERHHERGE